MKRLGDSKALISLISVIFLLFAGMAMTGCGTPLTQAAFRGDIDVVTELLNKGANVNEKDDANTALHLAAWEGHDEVVKLLLDRGAYVDPKGGWNKTPLVFAAEHAHIKTARLLVERGAKLDIDICKDSTNQGTCRAMIKALIAEKVEKENPIKTQTSAVSKPSIEISSVVKSDVDELPAIKAKPNKNSYAIVIGIESYRQKLPKADFAEHDAKTMTEYLTKAMGYPEENVVTLLNDRALKSDMEKYFENGFSIM